MLASGDGRGGDGWTDRRMNRRLAGGLNGSMECND